MEFEFGVQIIDKFTEGGLVFIYLAAFLLWQGIKAFRQPSTTVTRVEIVWKVREGRASLATEKPPVFGMIQRNGQVRMVMLPNVQQNTIKPFIEQTIRKGTLIYTDEYTLYSRLAEWGYLHKTVLDSTSKCNSYLGI